jgi:WD40-like Beta Propeller Repeat
MNRAGAALAASLLGACAGPGTQIVEDRFDIAESSSAPVVTEVADLGGGDVPLQGQLQVEASDGVAVIGETLWIHGQAFGRQPAVTVGGQPAAVLARTRDGGILVRVPPLTPSGSQPLVVSNDVGKGEKPVTVRRYAAILSGDAGQIAWAEVTADGPVAAGVTAVPGRRLLALSPDGRAAYLADTRRSVVDVIDVPANGGPRIVYQLDLGKERVLGLAAAGRAWTVAVVRESDVVLLDVTSPLRPARSAPRALPPEVRDARIVSADLSPDGKILAVAGEQGNRVTLLDMLPRGQAPIAAVVAILPDVRESVLSDLAFSPVGDTLWTASGDTPRSRASGPQPTQVFAVRVQTDAQGQVSLRVTRVVTIHDAQAPARLSTGRARPLASGSAIRLPPERATVFLTAQARPQADADDKMESPPVPPGVVFRLGAEDAATAAINGPGRIGQPDLSPDGRWLLAGLIADDGSVRLLSAASDARPGAPRSVPILGPTAKPEGRERQLPSVRVQP